jgi:hypothetical protein
MPRYLKNENVQCSPIPTRELLFGRIPGFTNLSPARNNMEMKPRMEHWWNDADMG